MLLGVMFRCYQTNDLFFLGKDQDEEVNEKSAENHDEIRFHPRYSPSLSLLENSTLALQRTSDEIGVCFMNRPLLTGEEIFVHRKDLVFDEDLKFGLTSTNPETFRSLGEVKLDFYCHKPWPHNKSQYACISLSANSSLMIAFDGNKQMCCIDNVKSNDNLWLGFYLENAGTCYRISHQNTCELQCHAFYTDVLYLLRRYGLFK